MIKILLASLSIALCAVPAAIACSIAVVPHEIDPAACAVDKSPPEPPTLAVERITRGRGPAKEEGGTISVTSCDDIGFLELAFATPARDERTPAAQLGYIAVTTAGELPAGMTLPDQPLRALDGTFTLHWIDGATDEQEPIDVSLALIAVDLAGNRSEPSEPVRVRHPGN